MRNLGRGVIVGTALLAACGGGTKNADTTSAAAPAASQPAAGASASASAPAGGAAAGTGTAQAATGKTWEVKMVGDEKGYRFEPADVTVKQGDGIKFVMVSGGPHNAAFDPATVPANAKAQLSANMPNQMSELNGPLLVNPNEAYTISFAKVPPGKYDYHCTPHLAMGMKGTITVQ